MPGPYSSLMVLRRRRSGRGGLRVPEKTDLRGLWEIYCRLKRNCAVILSYRAKYLPSRFKVPTLRLEIYRDWVPRTLCYGAKGLRTSCLFALFDPARPAGPERGPTRFFS